MQTQHGVLALAFSGGLDTSYCVPRLAEAGWTVHTVFVNTGGSTPEQRAAIRAQARAVGAVEHHEVDARREVYDRFVRYLVQGNVLRGEVYPLSVAAERTQQALSVLEVARAIGARAIAHGSTGAGNDQIRFDIALRVLAPDLEIVTPIREESVRREQSIAYLQARGLPVPEKAGSYSINRGLWGTTWGGGWTHDTWAGPPPELIDPPADAPASAEIVIGWEKRPAGLAGRCLARGARAHRAPGRSGRIVRRRPQHPRRRDGARHQGPHRLRGGGRAPPDRGAPRAREAGAHQVADLLEGPARPLLRRPAPRGALLRSRAPRYRGAHHQLAGARQRRDPRAARAGPLSGRGHAEPLFDDGSGDRDVRRGESSLDRGRGP